MTVISCPMYKVPLIRLPFVQNLKHSVISIMIYMKWIIVSEGETDMAAYTGFVAHKEILFVY
jgi:hypothetical protein